MDLLDHLRTIWHRKFRIIGLTLLVAVLVFVRSASADDVYGGDARLIVTSGSEVQSDSTVGFLAAGYAELVETDPALEDATSRADLDLDVDTANRRLSASADTRTGFITIDATGPSPAAAEALAQGAADALVARIDEQQADELAASLAPIDSEIDRIDAEIAALLPSIEDPNNDPRISSLERERDALSVQRVDVLGTPQATVEVVQPAAAGSAPISPTPRRDAAVAFVLAFVVIAELVVVLDLVSGRYAPGSAGTDVTEDLGLPVLARVPSGSAEERTEAFRALRTNLMFLTHGNSDPQGSFDWSAHRMRTLAIVSVAPGDGRTTVALGLAEVVAAVGARVVLIDADLRSPDLHTRLGLSRSPGIGDLPQGGDLSRSAQTAKGSPGLMLVPAGESVRDPAARLSGLRASMDRLSAELVIVDTPAAEHPEVRAVAAQCDAVVVVVDAGSSRRRDVVTLVHDLRALGARPAGVVLNRIERS